jgi:hypothetical protein
MHVFTRCCSTDVGRFITREEFIALVRANPGKVYDDIACAGFGGAPGFVLEHPDGSIGVEDSNSCFLGQHYKPVDISFDDLPRPPWVTFGDNLTEQ